MRITKIIKSYVNITKELIKIYQLFYRCTALGVRIIKSSYNQEWIFNEEFLGVLKSEKPECTRGTRGFRGRGQRGNYHLKTLDLQS